MRLNFDLFAKGAFQTTEEGVRLFYPNGLGSKGYLIDSDEQHQLLFEQQKRWGLSIMLIITTLVVTHVPWQIGLPVFILLNLLKQFFVRKNTRRMQVSTIPFSIDRFFGQALRLPTMKPATLKAFLAICALAGLLGIALTVRDPGIWQDSLGSIFFAALLFYLGLRQWRDHH